MDFEQARFNMVEQQIRTWEVLDQDVLDTLMVVKREYFVPEAHRSLAFGDIEIPIGSGQVMLTPVIEAKALQALAPKHADSVLEVGSGSGYMAALLASRAEWVRSIEIDPALARLAADNLARNGVENVIVEEGDGLLGLPDRAPFDLILLSGGVRDIPQGLLEQLKVGGRLFAFVGSAPVMIGTLVTRRAENAWDSENLFDTLVPMLREPQASQFRF
ncbi:protein-L-isoaspartate O-methyltransferase family protein [Uliginosibacterium sp. H1]|uniref:protein-L-isoaspartate O-methyltransferase family protein n=1 Tax=Uliginosibacterium sp. H1 TaxID=3114757 RepID=UPI002E170B90|nr:protein-L-isoaspartate O-methyltransferase [Uliginosibacterium sp. H1]